MRLRVGCSGWSYPEWVGPFYPKGTKADEYLKLYAKVFQTVEVDSSFYAVPESDRVRKWRADTPDEFTFCAKLPQEITGGRRAGSTRDKPLREEDAPDALLAAFLHAVDLLGPKRGPIVAQYPGSFAKKGHIDEVRTLLQALGGRRAAFEFRHESWFEPATYRMLADHGAALVWSAVKGVEIPAEVASNFVFLRFIGDRSFDPAGKIVDAKDRELKFWASRLDETEEKLRDGFVFFNNHFEGFGPESANRFLAVAGHPVLNWKRVLDPGGAAQRRLGEF